MKIKEVLQFLESRFPLAWQEDFDNSGMQCGDKEQEITGALVCFEFSDAVIEEAIRLKANLIVAHHPLIFGNGLKKIEPIDRVGRMVCKAIENKLVLYSMHTNVDSGIGGGNYAFAEKLKLKDCEVLDPKFLFNRKEDGLVGLGQVGKLPRAMSVPKFVQYVKDCLKLDVVKYAGNIKRPVKTVAVCGGSGSSLIRKALLAGADAYVTGDVRYHDFFIPDNQMLIIDVGHFEGEHFIKDILYAEIKENFSNFAIHFSKMDKLDILYA
ncbi:MAG: Nif3-like dinuclear metal center hexameric protein [Bacteroidales bacterium]|nr:Nif3-like dinuclear metal center hexameric protein [Bacteroidales bacterium]